MGVIPANQQDPNALPAAQQAANAKVVTPPSQLMQIGLSVAHQGVVAVSAAIDGLFGVAEAGAPAVTGDVLNIALNTVEHIAPGGVIKDAIIGGLLAGVKPFSHNIENTLSSAEIALLALVKARVDSYAADLEAKL